MSNLFLWTLYFFTILFLERLIYTISLKESQGKVIDRFFTQVTIGSYLLIVCVGLFEFIINRVVSSFSMICGMGLICAGIVLRRVSISTLGRNWSIYIKDIENQQYIRTGIYKYLRHPYYTAVSFELLGVSILFQSILALLLFFILHIPLLIIRISIENKHHRQKFFGH